MLSDALMMKMTEGLQTCSWNAVTNVDSWTWGVLPEPKTFNCLVVWDLNCMSCSRSAFLQKEGFPDLETAAGTCNLRDPQQQLHLDTQDIERSAQAWSQVCSGACSMVALLLLQTSVQPGKCS